jgi:hypothetical protein
MIARCACFTALIKALDELDRAGSFSWPAHGRTRGVQDARARPSISIFSIALDKLRPCVRLFIRGAGGGSNAIVPVCFSLTIRDRALDGKPRPRFRVTISIPATNHTAVFQLRPAIPQ